MNYITNVPSHGRAHGANDKEDGGYIEMRMEVMERKSKILEAAVAFNLPQPPLQEDLLLVQCSTVEEPGSTRKKEPNGI